MTDKIKIYLEDRLKRLEDIKNKREWTTAELGDATCCKQTLAFINSLQDEPVSNPIDLSPTLEDISIIRQIMFDYNRQIRNEMTIPNDKEYCHEVLKRFKAQKGE